MMGKKSILNQKENNMQNYSEFVMQHSPVIEATICEFLKSESKDNTLYEAMTYSVKAGGKKFRPLLFLATLSFLTYPIEKSAYQIASALEMIHTYSLIHDDLPAMDDDDLRRGMPTNHKQFGEAMAILAGDGLLTEAFDLVSVSDIDPKKLVQIIRIISSSAGVSGMIAGQVEDIQAEDKQVSLQTLQGIHEKKTGALILSAIQMACVLANSGKETREYLSLYGESIGIAFQIRDDLLDVIGDEKVIGKHTGSDEKLNKSTYVSLLGLDGATNAFYGQCEKAQQSLDKAKLNLGISAQEMTLLDEILTELKEIK